MRIQKQAMPFPLRKLCINTPRFVQTIPTSLSGRIEAIIRMYVSIQIKAKKLLKSNMCTLIPGYKSQLLVYKELVKNYKVLLRNKLAILLPYVREGKISLDKMQEAINDVQLSLFNPQNLVQWIDNKQTEFKELEAIYMHLKHLQLIKHS